MTTRPAIAVFFFFFALAVIFTAPVSLAPHERAVNDGDPVHISWILAWDAHQLTSAPFRLFESNSFYPYARSLAFSEHLLSVALIAAPFFFLTGNALFAQNMALLITLALSATAMYLLVREVLERDDAALVAGLVYAFHAYNFHEVPRIQLLSAQWLPLALLFLHRTFTRKTKRDAILFAVFFVLQGLATTYYLFYFALILAFWLPTYALCSERGMARAATLIAPLGVAGALFGLLAIPYFAMLSDFGFERSLTQGLDLVAYLSPPAQTIFSAMRHTEPVPESTPQFLGFIALALGLAGLFLREEKTRPQRVFLGLTIATGVIGLVLSLGPEIRVAGAALGKGPYFWLYEWFPPFRVLRSASRMSLLVHFSLAVLAGLGCRALLGRLRPTAASWARIALLVALPYEHFSGGQPSVTIPAGSDTPEVYAWLAQTPPDEAVVELPLYPRRQLRRHAMYMLYSTRHWRPIVFGRTSFYPALPSYLAWELRSFPDDTSLQLLERLGVSRIVVHPNQWPEDERASKLAELRRFADRLEPEGRFAPLTGKRFATYGLGDERVFRLRRKGSVDPTAARSLCVPGDEIPPASFALAGDSDIPEELATDRDPRTKWRSERQLPSLKLEIDLGREETVSAITLGVGYPHDEFPRDLTLKARSNGPRFERVPFRDDVETKWELVDALVNEPTEAAMTLRFEPIQARRLRLWVREGADWDFALPHWTLPEIYIYRRCE